MKIMFLCGSLEPGRDGVGDYTQRLACELMRMGHQVSVIAMNDRFVKTVSDTVEVSDGSSPATLRLPSGMELSKRFEKAGQWTEKYNPEWISLQYVPFAFHPKGLTYQFGRYLSKLGKGRNWHILFHELWLGMHAGSSKKESLWGYIQRRMILSMIATLKPKRIHTQSELYRRKLEQEGIHASLLPLFSNIPVRKSDHLTNRSLGDDNHIVFVLFGEVHSTGGPVEEFASEIKSYADQNGLKCSLMIMGRSGNEQVHWKKNWESLGMEVNVLGELSTEDISANFQKAGYGITTTVYGKVEKSGSVAAMLEHGLRVVCVAGQWKPKGMGEVQNISGVMEYKKGNIELLFSKEWASNKFCTLEEVSDKLITSFKL